LLYFMTIATEGSVAKAAKKLRLGQSTLSTQLCQFEDHLGLKLFDRRQQRLYLSEAGRIALQYAREIFKLGDEMLDTLHDRREVERVSVQIGALDSVPKAIVVKLVESAQSKYPCTISVAEGNADELLRALKAHEIDLALLNHQPSVIDRTGLKARMAGRSPVVILGNQKFLRLKKNFPDSLAGEPCLLPASQTRLRHEVDHYFKVKGIHIDLLLEAQDLSLLTLLAANGVGILPVSLAVASELQGKYGLRLIGTLDNVHDELWLIGSERRIDNPVAAHLLKSFEMDGS